MADGVLGAEALAQLSADLRPRLHRYCARMMGSSVEGEDVVQDTLMKAVEALPRAGVVDQPEHWLFRIAHNTALDALRHRGRRAGASGDLEQEADPGADAEARIGTWGSFAAFLALPPTPRAAVVLADVLGYSLGEIVEILDITLPAAKAALHRGRARLQATRLQDPPAIPAAERALLQRYADLFNAHDFDALRDLLAEGVRLDLANRLQLNGRKDVSVYFSRYAEKPDARLGVGLADGRPALLVREGGDLVQYVVLLDWAEGKIAGIRDFLYAPYVMDELSVFEG
jgi:RNA polymerase sigma-70 factor (ECF subfamily)